MAYKTSAIDLNVPAKVIPVNASNLSNNAFWPHQNVNGSEAQWLQNEFFGLPVRPFLSLPFPDRIHIA